MVKVRYLSYPNLVVGIIMLFRFSKMLIKIFQDLIIQQTKIENVQIFLVSVQFCKSYTDHLQTKFTF